jgi:hypothetical protein
VRAQLLFWSVRVITTAAIHFGQFEWQIRNVWAFHLLGFFSFENMLAVAAPPSSSASAAGAGELSTVSNPWGISAGAASAAGASGSRIKCNLLSKYLLWKLQYGFVC